MKIVVLDGYVLNPGDISWAGFEEIGEVTVYDRSEPETVVERIGDAEIILTNKTVIDRGVIEKCHGLKYIGVNATGYNVVDVAAAKEAGIVVTNVPAYGTDAVAQFTFALMLELCNKVGLHSRSVASGDWIKTKDFSYNLAPLIDIRGKTLGIIGFGSIGSRVAQIATAFGMNVLVNSRTEKPLPEAPYISGSRISWADRETVLKEADIITLHCPLFPETERLINRESIAVMKDGAMLINTARGGLIAEQDLADALNSGKLAGAALDVVDKEPMAADNPLISAKNVIITPHIAWASVEARERLMGIAVENLKAYLAGNPCNVVN
ncbi:MAG: D-2-hydroxyacid dehydrogenase [Coprococcus sp.]|nr:D-2-hydroxyacid dehydrogenase [Coprococcus sp.]